MPATRSSGPPTAASLQPILMEALENFKQKHSKQNQDLIHKNRLLLKSTAELERVNKELKNENLDLRVAARRAEAAALEWRRRAEAGRLGAGAGQTEWILRAVADISTRCRVLEASLAAAAAPTNDVSHASVFPRDSLPAHAHPLRGRAELIALRERRRSQLPVDAEESRLSFIHECSGAEDRSEASLLEGRQAETDARPLSPAPGPSGSRLVPNDGFVAQRSARRQNVLPTFPESPLGSASDSPSIGASSAGSWRGEPEDEPEDEPEGEPESDESASEAAETQSSRECSGSLDTSTSCASDRARLAHRPGADEDDPQAGSSSASSDTSIDAAEPGGERTALDDQSPEPVLSAAQRLSRKQRRTSLTPVHILETVPPAAFTLSAIPLPASAAPPTRRRRKGAVDREEEARGAVECVNGTGFGEARQGTKRRDSGLAKEAESEGVGEGRSQDEGWERSGRGLKKRARAELDAVREEHQPGGPEGPLVEVPANLSGAGQREARRARKEVNYALPSLNKKMRRPADYGPPKRPSGASSAGTQRKTSAGRSAGATPSTVSLPSNTLGGVSLEKQLMKVPGEQVRPVGEKRRSLMNPGVEGEVVVGSERRCKLEDGGE